MLGLFALCCSVYFLGSGCSSDKGTNATDGGGHDANATDGGENEFLDGQDSMSESIDVSLDADDISSETDLSFGWIRPRCGNDLVDTCADCPGFPYLCDKCEFTARCVADCAAECDEHLVGCLEGNECIYPGMECKPEPLFCECPPFQKACMVGGEITCVENCSTQCPG